jgi:hypothetical protein
MSDVISLREQLAQAELSHHRYGRLNKGDDEGNQTNEGPNRHH